jgi:chromosome segregation ATPase
MYDFETRISSIKNSIEEKKREVIKLETQIQDAEPLLKELGIDPEKAEDSLAEIDKEIKILSEELEVGVSSLEKIFIKRSV